jgi:hypothetical protein
MSSKHPDKRSKRRKSRVKKSPLSDLVIQEIPWRDWSPQFVLLLPLIDRPNPLEAFRTLRQSARRYTSFEFDGTVRSWKEISRADPAALALMQAENPEFFETTNRTLFTIFDFPTPTISDPNGEDNVEITAQAIVALVTAYKGLDGPQTTAATRAKALCLWALVGEDELARSLCEAYFDGDDTLGGAVRARWNAAIPIVPLEPDVDWAVEFITWGLQKTPCIPLSYEPPIKPPWPVSALEPIAGKTETILDNVIAWSSQANPHRFSSEVLSGLFARMRDLARLVRTHSQHNEGMAAEIMLRCLADSAVQATWLLHKNDSKLYEQFEERSHGSEKGLLDELRQRSQQMPIESEIAKRALQTEYAELFKKSGRWPELMDVVYGPWSDLSTSAMFRELPDVDSGLTFTTWMRASDSVHGSWRSISKYQLSECQNPFHLGHHIAEDQESVTAGITPVLSSMLIPLFVLSSYASRYSELVGLDEAVEKTRNMLADWVIAHQRPDGSFIWHDEPLNEPAP